MIGSLNVETIGTYRPKVTYMKLLVFIIGFDKILISVL